MRRCSVPGCYSNYTKPYVSVFTFPKDSELCKLWLKNIGRPTLKVHENIGVCIKHFEKNLIIGIDSSTISRKKLSIKYGSVPTIFEDECSSSDNPKLEKKIQSVDKIPRIQRKNTKSPSSCSDGNSLDKSGKLDDEKRETVKSLKKVSITTDKPIITIIKAEDLTSDLENSPEKMEEDNKNPNEDLSNPKSPTSASPIKSLSNVSVCLKDEDRVPVIRELKGVKRSPSTGSNSSTGSSDVQKSLLLMKRRKVEKPAPVVLGRQNDCYCWVCHRENISLTCIACPRAYHVRCAGENNNQLSLNTTDWVCPECQRILAAENVDTRSSTLAEISLERLGSLLKLSLNKMKLRAPIAFHQPVSLDHYPKYLHYVIHPMDFSLLEKNIKQKVYGCTEAFLADVKWISHNSCVFNGTQHPLSTNAKNLVKSCDQDMQEIEVCPDCFVHSVVRNKYWFSEVCRKPHPLVWAKLKGFPYWPAKVVRIADGNVDARFFGAHDRAWVPVSQCYHLSKEMPTTSKPKKKGNYEVALDELNFHVQLLIQKFGRFEYAPYRTNFNPEDKTLTYHGIDIDMVSKEDIVIDSNPQRELNLLSFEKENRFASFLESESEKSNVEETRSGGIQSKVQSSRIFEKIESESPSFIIQQRISIDSNVSEKEVPSDESKSTVELKSVEDLKSIDESKDDLKSPNKQVSAELTKSAKESDENAEMKKTNISLNISGKESDKLSDTNQLRKLELALQRIKGYVSLNVESEKENEENVQSETCEKNKESEKDISEVLENDKTEKSKVLSPLFKESMSLPSLEPSENQEKTDGSVALETTKKTDSFLLKLSETIESCKAKLGISEIDDDLSSDESAIDDNASRSDEDEEDETSASEAEISGEEADEDADEGESMEVSDEEVENENDDSGESDEEESDDQVSESSDTDIESLNETSPKKKLNLSNEDNKTDTEDGTCKNNMDIVTENSIKSLTNDSNEAIITNLDMQVPEVTIDASGAVEIVEESSVSESSNDIKDNSESSLIKKSSEGKISKTMTSQECTDDSVSNDQSNNFSHVSKEVNSNMKCIQNNDNHSLYDVNRKNSPFKNIVNNSSPMKEITSPRESIDKESVDIKPGIHVKQDNSIIETRAASPFENKNENEDDDDEILICTPTRPKSPPVIVLDDDLENENSSTSDTFAIKSPPYSTSVDSFSNEENPNCRTNSGDDPDNNQEKMDLVDEISHEEVIENNEEKLVNTNSNILDSKNTEERRKRKFSSDSSSDDEDIQVVTPVKKSLTGAIRTFHKPSNNVPSLKPATPTVESVKRNLERDSLNQINKSPVLTDDSAKEASSPQKRSQLPSPSIAEKLLKNPVDTSNLSEKDKEIFYLKSKLNCVLTAYQIQSWKCSQEREELRHNMNLVVMEMRACLESDKKQAVEALSKKFELEKQKCIEEAKRKQWCANCLTESRYACCWNTSYCSVDCQKKHFPEHRHSCSQLKSKNEIVELKQKSIITTSKENNENKKVYILTKPIKPKSSDASQQGSVIKPQIQVKQQLQIGASNNIGNNIQFVIAPVKSTSESTNATSTPTLTIPNSKEQSLNASQIMNQVRNCDLGTAITLLKKRNIEATVANLKKEEDNKQKETNLEDIYFPSPPKITFEGYETATPDPNVVLDNDEELKDESIIDPDDIELPTDVTLEPDVVFSDTDEKDNEMVNIGHGVEIKAKFLNKCLVYGQTAKKLTRCLVDVIFPDVKLLATCSAFGQKSNVTKLTRAALPSRKVHAIIDYVSKRFPGATRSEIVLQINMKCKEARVILSKRESEAPKKATARRLLAREKEGELAATGLVTPNASSSNISSILTSVTSPVSTSPGSNIVSNLVCVKSAANRFSFNTPSRPQSLPNILRCNSQILIKPKPLSTVNQPILNTVGKTAILQAGPVKRRETVRNLLAAKMNVSLGNLSKNAQKLVMALDTSKSPTSSTQVMTSNAASTNIRPYIIIGSQMNPVKSPSSSSTTTTTTTASTQNAALPMSSPINK